MMVNVEEVEKFCSLRSATGTKLLDLLNYGRKNGIHATKVGINVRF
jgi:hypothetical protein